MNELTRPRISSDYIRENTVCSLTIALEYGFHATYIAGATQSQLLNRIGTCVFG